MYLKSYCGIVTGRFSVQHRAVIIVLTVYSKLSQIAFIQCLYDLGVIILPYRCLDVNWLKNLLLTVHYLCMCKSISAHDVVLIILLYIL